MKRVAGSLSSLLLYLVLAGFCLTPVSCMALHRPSYFLQVPALHLSVGQQFTPRLVSRTALTDAPLIRVELLDSAGGRLWTETLPLPLPGHPASLSTLSLPRPGRYRLVARPESRLVRGSTVTVVLETAPEPPPYYGGVEAVDALGLGNGVAQYLQSHAFAVTDGLSHDNAPLILIGDPRLIGYPLRSTYRQLWARVAAGAHLLLLNPPMPELAPFFPFQTDLVSARDCRDDLFPASLVHMHDGDLQPGAVESVIRPVVGFDLSKVSRIVPETLDATPLPSLPGGQGFAGCHALFSFRYGSGWVTVSSLPLLQHFSDTWARVYLMNLMKTASRRVVKGSPAGGLAQVDAARLRTVGARPDSHLRLAAAWYPAPDAAPVTPWPAPAVIDGSAGSCFTSPAAGQSVGQRLWLSLGTPTPLRSVQFTFGGQSGRPTAFVVEATTGNDQWVRLGDQSQVNSQGVASYSASGHLWTGLRLRITANQLRHPWSVCEITPVATPPAAAADTAPARSVSQAGHH